MEVCPKPPPTAPLRCVELGREGVRLGERRRRPFRAATENSPRPCLRLSALRRAFSLGVTLFRLLEAILPFGYVNGEVALGRDCAGRYSQVGIYDHSCRNGYLQA